MNKLTENPYPYNWGHVILLAWAATAAVLFVGYFLEGNFDFLSLSKSEEKFSFSLFSAQVKRGHLAEAKPALDKGIDINRTDQDGETLLLWAISQGNTETAEWLIHNGANVNAADPWGNTPLHKATLKAQARICRLLVDKGAIIQERNGNIIFLTKYLLGEIKDINQADKDGNTLLHLATFYNCTKIVNQLVADGAKVNVKNKQGMTPLHYEAWEGNVEGCRLFISKGADINARDNKGGTPLTWAIFYNRTEVIKLLKQNGGI